MNDRFFICMFRIDKNINWRLFKKSINFYFSHLPAEVLTLALKLQRRRTARRQGLALIPACRQAGYC